MSRILQQNRETSQPIIGKFRTEDLTYTNPSGSDPVTLTQYRLMGQVLATGKVLPQDCDATDGSEMPYGVLAEEYTVAASGTITVSVIVEGQIIESAIGLASGETLASTVRTVSTGGGVLRGLIRRNTHITLVETTELSAYDNTAS